MSKNQSKQVFNAANTNMSGVQQQGQTNNSQLQGAESGYQSNASSLYPGIAGGYSDISSSGGYDPSILSSLNTGYEGLSTGGISPSQVSSLSSQAAQSGRAGYDVASDQLKRTIASTGGYGFSGAAEANLGRQASAASSNATNSMLGNLVGLQSQNTIAGLGGLQGTQQAQVGNKLAGLAGSSGLYNTNVNASQNTMEQILQNYATTGQLSQGDLKILSGIAQTQPNWWQNVQSGVGSIGGIASGVLGAIGGL